MRRLFKLEWKKLVATRYFKVLAILWLLAFLAIPTVAGGLLAWMDSVTSSWDLNLKPSQLPIFDFVDLWQNLTYFYKMITIFICFTVVISMTNEYSYKTVRQNVIDGLSKRELWLSKITLILGLSLIATIMLVVLGLVVGFIFSPVKDMPHVFENFAFVGAYFLQVFLFLSFCLFISTLIKRAGFALALVLFWAYPIEGIITSVTDHYVGEFAGDLFPIEASWNLIRQPILKYALSYTQDYVGAQDVAIALFWIALFLWGSYRLLAKRDL